MQSQRSFLFIALAAFMGVILLVTTQVSHLMSAKKSWTEAKEDIRAGKVERVQFEAGSVELFYPAEGENPGNRARTERVVLVDADKEGLVKLLEEKTIPYEAIAPSACESAAGSWLLPLILMIGIMAMMGRRDGGVPPGVATFGKSQARLAPEEGTGVTFADVAGIDEAIEELKEIVQFLKTPEKFTALGGKIPKGVLLVGPPGTGKTLLARAVAGEAGVPFFSISGSDFVEMFVGVGAARVRDLFHKAADHAPCIIFIDELDAVGKARGGSAPVGGHDEREQTLNQILVEMDGFDGRKGIILIGATNRPETLDPALLRPGRFDRQVLVDRPDVRGREAILKVHARNLRLSADVDLNQVARITPGFAGADLALVLNEAALLAARQDKTEITPSDVEAAVERIVVGLEKKSRRLSEKVKRVVAYHEAGHAICAAAFPGSAPVQKVSIIPRGIGALGYTLKTPTEDRYLVTRTELLNELVTLYGGRTAEELVFGEITTGASDDIRKASDIARNMIAQYGMSEKMGLIDYQGGRSNPFGIGGGPMRDVSISEDTARRLDEETHRLLEAAWRRSRKVLTTHRELLDRMANALLEKESLDRDEIKAFLDEVELSPLTEEQLRAPA